MLTKLFKKFVPFLILILWTQFTQGSSNPDNFSTLAFENAIKKRNDYLKSIEAYKDGLSANSWTSERRQTILQTLSNFPDPQNPWYNFIYGMILSNEASKGAEFYFSKAISESQYDPGTLWVLFMEFLRYGKKEQAEEALLRLEKQMLEHGGVSMPLVAQTLLYLGKNEEKQKNLTAASFFYTWANHFDQSQPWSNLRIAMLSFPYQFDKVVESLSQLFHQVKTSWYTQVQLVRFLHKWVSDAVSLFVIVVFILLGIKYLPIVLHPLIDIFPLQVSYRIRAVLTSTVISSFIAFGVLPFFWVVSMLFWGYLEKRERILLGSILLIMIAAPLNCKLADMFSNALQLDGSLSIFNQATYEPYSTKTYSSAYNLSRSNSTDFFSHLAESICALKLNQLDAALAAIDKALSIRPSDPVALVTAGNIRFVYGNLDRATTLYQKAISIQHSDLSGLFNLGQVQLRQMQTIQGTENIREATLLNSRVTNTFISRNDFYFSKDWPAMRTFMYADYTPTYFWLNIFPKFTGSWKTADQLWGLSFLGINTIFSIIISVILFIAILALNKNFQSPQAIKKIFNCRFCNRPICKDCKKGMLCSDCADSIRFARSEKAAEQIRLETLDKSTKNLAILTSVASMAFPGSGSILSGKSPIYLWLPLLILSCFVFAGYRSLLSVQTIYPGWVIDGLREFIFTLIIIYILGMIIAGAVRLTKIIKVKTV